ncbi:MAG: chemotaxis protein CheW [Thermodesulfobacteriota bacterium]
MEKEVVEVPIRQFCTFRINGRLYGIDIRDVKEISPEIGFTPIFHASRAVKGYMNIRGRIYLLLDLRRMLGIEDKAVDGNSRVILFKPEVGENFGILVDNVADIESVDGAQIENRRKQDRELPEGRERRGIDIAAGICKMEKELLVVINSKNLLGIAVNPKIRTV